MFTAGHRAWPRTEESMLRSDMATAAFSRLEVSPGNGVTGASFEHIVRGG
jgi:hypothetical protein